MDEIKMVAFDFGGVLACLDFSKLTDIERILYKVYMNRFDSFVINDYAQKLEITSNDLLMEAERNITRIINKLYRLNPTAFETLDMIREEKIIPSIWTNGITQFGTLFEELGLDKYIAREYICNSIFLGVDKPDTKFYTEALRQTQMVPKEVLFFDDLPQNITSAKVCHINAFLYKNEDRLCETVEKKLRRFL